MPQAVQEATSSVLQVGMGYMRGQAKVIAVSGWSVGSGGLSQEWRGENIPGGGLSGTSLKSGIYDSQLRVGCP